MSYAAGDNRGKVMHRQRVGDKASKNHVSNGCGTTDFSSKQGEVSWTRQDSGKTGWKSGLDLSRHHVIELPPIAGLGGPNIQLYKVANMGEIVPILARRPPDLGQKILVENTALRQSKSRTNVMMESDDEFVPTMDEAGQEDAMANDNEMGGTKVPNSFPSN